MPEQALYTYIGVDNPDPTKPLILPNPLIPDGIEKFVPRCVVCTQPVPSNRARGRSKDTCSPACHKVLRQYRDHCLKSSRCPSCYHPSTPTERKEFIAWRKHRGDRREGKGRPPVVRESALREALKQALTMMRASSQAIHESEARLLFPQLVEQLDAEILNVEKILGVSAPQAA